MRGKPPQTSGLAVTMVCGPVETVPVTTCAPSSRPETTSVEMPSLMPVRTGISDGISTEVVSGLDEGAQVVTGTVSTGPQTIVTANPLVCGGFPRMRCFNFQEYI